MVGRTCVTYFLFYAIPWRVLFRALLHSSSSFSPPGQLKKLIEIKNDIVKFAVIKKKNNQEPIKKTIKNPSDLSYPLVYFV